MCFHVWMVGVRLALLAGGWAVEGKKHNMRKMDSWDWTAPGLRTGREVWPWGRRWVQTRWRGGD